MKWIKFKDEKPKLIYNGRLGCSNPVLTMNKKSGDDPIVQRYCKGGRGDLTTEYWSHGEPVTHWAKITN